MDKNKKFILWFNELFIKDVPLVGGKNASLGEMYRNLTRKGVRIPNGFAVTAFAYNYFLEKAKIKNEINSILKNLDKKDAEMILNKIYSIRDNPFRFLKRLQGEKLWRLRISDYRAIVDVVVSANKIVVVRIGHRKNVYD